MEDGRVARFEVPEGTTPEQATSMMQAHFQEEQPRLSKSIKDKFKESVGEIGNVAAGAVRGAGSIGATVLAPYDIAKDAIAGKGLSLESNQQRRKDIDVGLSMMGADPNSKMYQAGKIGAEIAGTSGIGGVIAKPLAGIAPKLSASIASGGFRTGGGPTSRLAELLTRGFGGAVTGGATAGMVDPMAAGTGAAIGGAYPIVAKGAGIAGHKLAAALSGGKASPEVVALADKAAAMGIDIPADRIVNSRPLNAISSALNYVPLSGRAATEDLMQSQMNKALTKTIGQSSDNVTASLRQAAKDLGGVFDDTLKNNTVKLDTQFLDDLARVERSASTELGKDSLKAISGQIDEIINKGMSGKIEGQAAYNIKKTLDRIGRRSGPEAFHAREMKKTLMAALDRSLGPDKAAAFENVRKQYVNMLSLENLAKNGADGDVSVARIANMKNINNPELQDIADVAAQFLKSREGQHGAAQRVLAGTLAGVTGGVPALATGMLAGRATNKALNSTALKNALLGKPMLDQAGKLAQFLKQGIAEKTAIRAIPVISAQ